MSYTTTFTVPSSPEEVYAALLDLRDLTER